MVTFDKVKNSGKVRKMKSGVKRDRSKGKGRYDLLPPEAIRRLAKHYENGAKIYGDRNWEIGMPLSWLIDSALRHIFQILERDQSEDHAAAALWNIAGFITMQERIEKGDLLKELDDLK